MGFKSPWKKSIKKDKRNAEDTVFSIAASAKKMLGIHNSKYCTDFVRIFARIFVQMLVNLWRLVFIVMNLKERNKINIFIRMH